jgi:hypothetical protein
VSEQFGEDYYLRGPETGLSNYENYRWLPEPTILCAWRMMNHLGAHPGDSVLDWGCARGYYVKALRILGYDATGYDLSRWAVENCDPDVAEFVSNNPSGKAQDWVLCKDVLEHVPLSRIADAILRLILHAKRGVLIVVPLASEGIYINPADRQDSTHLIAWKMEQWLAMIQDVIDSLGHPFTVSGGYKLPGVKQAADPFPMSTAFITIRRYHK